MDSSAERAFCRNGSRDSRRDRRAYRVRSNHRCQHLEELRIQRVMRRDGVGEEAVKARLRNQTSEEERLRIAHHVMMNDDRQLVIPQVLAIHADLLNFAAV